MLFQSTLPSQGATGAVGVYFCAVDDFNPRSPHRERRSGANVTDDGYKISIHAPLTGSDEHGNDFNMMAYDFNPRSPHRERRQYGLV